MFRCIYVHTKIEEGESFPFQVWEDEYESLSLVSSELNSFLHAYFSGDCFHLLNEFVRNLEWCFVGEKKFNYSCSDFNLTILVTKEE